VGSNQKFKEFVLRTAESVADLSQREKVAYAIDKYEESFATGLSRYSKLAVARQRAGYLKNKALNELDRYLIEFEDNFTSNGGKIIWARDAEEARDEIAKIIKKRGVSKVVKSKSMITEEIHLNEFLISKGVDVYETDLGEFIVQLAGDKTFHIVTPAMHFSKEDVSTLYAEKLSAPENLTPEEITQFTRNHLRPKFAEAQMGITGANFLISDMGGVAITENEGNGLLTMSVPKTHLVIAGIDKLIPSLENLDIFWPLLASHGTGQSVTAYNSIITGPRKEGEFGGPEEVILILIDNGRTNILAQEKQRQALSCIKCGACLNACPVYKLIGGKAYGTTYQGPIGAVLTPFLLGFDEYSHLSFASSLCGKCDTVCPVNIPLHNMLIYNRNYAVKNGFKAISNTRRVKWFTKVSSSRKLLDLPSSSLKNMIVGQIMKKSWGKDREMPKLADKSFNQQYKERN